MERLDRRIWPITVSAVFVILGTLYVFEWANVVAHHPFVWDFPLDLGATYQVATVAAHGHLGEIYQPNVGTFTSFPGIVVAMAPLGALSSAFHVSLIEVEHNHHLLAHPIPFISGGPANNPTTAHSHGSVYVVQPWWIAAVLPYALILSSSALFACDALAERLGVAKSRRAVLAGVEAVLLWNVAVIFGHPEDAVALALAVYALVFAIDGRFTGAGWLFGAAVAFQPLVLLMLPVILVMAGWPRGLGVAVRSVIPAAVLLVPPLIASFRRTVDAVADQPGYPTRGHVTPWTALAPTLSAKGQLLAVASGPGRIVAVLLALGLGFWVATRWREQPGLLVWACAVALALRCYTESVMDPFYVWPALALAVVVAARGSARLFQIAAALAIVTTVIAQWRLGWIAWWSIDMAGLTALLVASSRAAPLPVAPAVPVARRTSGKIVTGSSSPGKGGAQSKKSSSAAAKKKKTRKAARADRTRAGRR